MGNCNSSLVVKRIPPNITVSNISDFVQGVNEVIDTTVVGYYVPVSGGIMTGGLSAPSISASTIYVGASTIFFVDNNGNVLNSLNSSDVVNFDSAYTTLNNISAGLGNTGEIIFENTFISTTANNDIQIVGNRNYGVTVTSDNYLEFQYVGDVGPVSAVGNEFTEPPNNLIYINGSGIYLANFSNSNSPIWYFDTIGNFYLPDSGTITQSGIPVSTIWNDTTSTVSSNSATWALSGLESVVPGAGINIDNTDPSNPIINNEGIRTITSGNNIYVDITDPNNVIVGASAFSPAGTDAQVQFNSGGVFSASSNLTYDYNNNILNALCPINAACTYLDGNYWATNYGFAAFSNKTQLDQYSYAIIQDAYGMTYVNSSPENPLRFRIGNVDALGIDGNGYTIYTANGAQIVNNYGALSYALGQTLVDGNNIYYPNGAQLADNAGNLYTTTLYNTTNGIGVMISGAGGTDYGQLRIVGNGSAWTDNQQTTYFQIKNGTNNMATFMGGAGGTDAPLDRLQFASYYNTFVDGSYTNTPVPDSLIELIGHTGNKRLLKIHAIDGNPQTVDYMTVIDSTNNPVFAIESDGTVATNKLVVSGNDSGNWQNTYTSVNTNSANWCIGYKQSNILAGLSANNQSVYSDVNTNSAVWNSIIGIESLSSKWCSVYSSYNSSSANNSYTTVNTNSANWNIGYNQSNIYASNSANYALLNGANSFSNNNSVLVNNTSAFVVAQSVNGPAVFRIDTSAPVVGNGMYVSGGAAGGGFVMGLNSTSSDEPLYIQSKNGGNITIDASPGNANGAFYFRIGKAARYNHTNYYYQYTPGAASNSVSRFLYTGAADTSLTSSVEASNIYWNLSNTRQHTGSAVSITLQRDFRINPSTHSMTVASGTIVDCVAFAVDSPPIAGANTTITNVHGLLLSAATVVNGGVVTNAYGATINAPTGATNNYAAQFIGQTNITKSGGNGLSIIPTLSGSTTGVMLQSTSLSANESISLMSLGSGSVILSGTNFKFNTAAGTNVITSNIAGTTLSGPSVGNTILTLNSSGAPTCTVSQQGNGYPVFNGSVYANAQFIVLGFTPFNVLQAQQAGVGTVFFTLAVDASSVGYGTYNTMAMRNGTNAQELRVYNTYTSTTTNNTNLESLRIMGDGSHNYRFATMLGKQGGTSGKLIFATDDINDYGVITNGTTRMTIASGGITFGATNGTPVNGIRHGTSSAMVAGTVNVSDLGCTANTRYSFTTHTIGTISLPATYYASTRSPASGFIITSSMITDTSTVDWFAVEP